MDDTLAEKRLFTEHGETTDIFVAAGVGVVRVSVSGDRVGEFGVIHRCSPADIAASAERLVVATDEDVVVSDGRDFSPTGFGPSIAVGFDAGVRAASPDGHLADFDDEWRPIGELDTEIRAIDGNLVATADGVYRMAGELVHAGLSDVKDVATDGLPLAATPAGLYSLGNGWMAAAEGAFHAVATGGDRAHAATAQGAFERIDGDWKPVDFPTDAPPVDFAYDAAVFAATADGTLAIDSGDGFRAHPLGIPEVCGIAVPG